MSPNRNSEAPKHITTVETVKTIFDARTPIEKKQQLLDEIFTQKQREELVQNASKDSNNQPVRYYRYTSYKELEALLTTGTIDVFTLRYKPDSVVDTSEMQKILASIPPDIAEKLHAMDLIHETYKTVVSFLDTHLPKNFKHWKHSASPKKALSPYLSMSVGGPIKLLGSAHDTLYIECVIPTSQVEFPVESRIQGEKEVYVRKIQRANVSRVFLTDEKLEKEVIEDPNTPVGRYHFQNPDVYNPIEKWRWAIKTQDCFPTDRIVKETEE